MIFGKHINRYYLRFLPLLLLGFAALIVVDYLQLLIPNLYQMVINGINTGFVDGVAFDVDFLVERSCMPMVGIILLIVLGRFLWRVCFFSAGIKAETDMRNRMFNHCKDLSQEFYHQNNVGGLMSLYTNDLDTVQECYSWGIMECCDAVFLGGLAIVKMWRMNPLLTSFALIPMGCLMGASIVVGKRMSEKWERRQEALSNLSDFAQESFSGIAVVKAFVTEAKELWAFKKLSKENE